MKWQGRKGKKKKKKRNLAPDRPRPEKTHRSVDPFFPIDRIYSKWDMITHQLHLARDRT